MEFLNDFLEAEAPRMNEFLHQISSRSSQPPADTVLDWPGYIDEGKQLAILHHLLAESIQKLPQNRQSELGALQSVLDGITKAKLSNSFGTNGSASAQQNQENNNSIINQHNASIKTGDATNVSQTIIKPLGNGERGIMRGVLTPSSLEKNIFRYNDPTVSPLLNAQQHENQFNQSQNSINGNGGASIYPIQHSHSTSSISTVSNHNYQHHHLMPAAVHHHHHHNHAPSPERYHFMQQQQQQQMNVATAGAFGTVRNCSKMFETVRNCPNHGIANGHKSPTIRASTLPRNNHIQTTALDSETTAAAKNLIQIGVDTSSAFVRKSPTPLLKAGGATNGSSQRQHKLNGSQLSLLSDRSTSNSNKNALNLNLGIPHSHGHQSVASARVSNHNSNMPMKLEDLDDLLKYADEHAAPTGDEMKPSQGSNTSIGHCSSGYQSIATQSQSSTSPVDLANGCGNQASSGEFNNNNNASLKHSRRVTNGQYGQANTKYNNANGATATTIITNGIINPPLAFKNPLYQLQSSAPTNSASASTANSNGRRMNHVYNGAAQLHSRASPKSSSLTPSSSDERLSNATNDKYSPMEETNGNTINERMTSSSGAASDKEQSNTGTGSRRMTAGSNNLNGSNTRMPRTNPLMQVNIQRLHRLMFDIHFFLF